jgi:hypothetical protein
MADDEGTPDPDDTADDDSGDGDQSEEQQAEYKPPSKEEWEKARNAAKKAREERDKARSELASSRREKQTEEETAAERAAEQQKWQRTAVTNAAVAELQGAGYTKAQARRLSKLIDLSNVDIDDEGDIDLEEEIEQLAKDFPPDKGVARGGGRVTTGRGREDSQPKDDVDARFAKRLLRQSG